MHPYLSLLWVFYAGILGTFEDNPDEDDEYAVIPTYRLLIDLILKIVIRMKKR